MDSRRMLIVNADDFGQSAGINEGVFAGSLHGIVTSASLMVRWPAAQEAAAFANAHKSFSVGLHIDLGEWIFRDLCWRPKYQVVDLEDAAAVRTEIMRQLEAFRGLLGRDPSHFDSHQHVHREEPVRSIVASLGELLGVPVRHLAQRIRYIGAFYGQTGEGVSCPQAITLNALQAVFSSLPSGIHELGCHPALRIDFDSMYASERLIELEVLCNPRVRKALVDERIEKCSFHDIADRARS